MNCRVGHFHYRGKGCSGLLTNKQGQAASGSDKNLPAELCSERIFTRNLVCSKPYTEKAPVTKTTDPIMTHSSQHNETQPTNGCVSLYYSASNLINEKLPHLKICIDDYPIHTYSLYAIQSEYSVLTENQADFSIRHSEDCLSSLELGKVSSKLLKRQRVTRRTLPCGSNRLSKSDDFAKNTHLVKWFGIHCSLLCIRQSAIYQRFIS